MRSSSLVHHRRDIAHWLAHHHGWISLPLAVRKESAAEALEAALQKVNQLVHKGCRVNKRTAESGQRDQ